jgi:hypothetical protein
MRLPVRDDPVASARSRVRSQTVGEREQLAELRCRRLHRLSRRLGERPAGPPLVPLEQRELEVTAARQLEANGEHGRPGGGGRTVQLGEQRDDAEPVVVVAVRAELARLSVHERKQCDRIALVEPAQRLAVACPDRRDDETQAGGPQSGGRVERVRETLERLVVRIAEPRLPAEVVDGDKAACATLVRDVPVVAPGPDGHILDGVDLEAPPVVQCVDDGVELDTIWERVHQK